MISLALGGCVGGGAATTPTEPMPANYRAIVSEHVRKTFFDPYSVRDASIAAPKPGQLSRSDAIAVESGWLVCLRSNAKNRMGGYAGLTTTAMIVRGGTVVTSHSGEDHYEVRTNCAAVAYEPFPEIEPGYKPPTAAPQRPKRG